MDTKRTGADHAEAAEADRVPPNSKPHGEALPPEVDGAKGPEPTRHGDWQHKGRCTDF